MKRHEQSFRRFLDRSFGRFLNLPAAPVDPAWERVLERLREEPEGASLNVKAALDSVRPIPSIWMARQLWIAAAAVLVVAVTLSVTLFPGAAPATVESVDGGLHRVVDGKIQTLQIRESIEMGYIIRSNGGSGGSLKLADGSYIEMRKDSELWLERANDGVRVQLRNGGIIVKAAKQRTGHLYVQTKDVTVSVVGTVFLVNAAEEGSRVAVIEGEVHVQQGATETKLRSGEQVTSNPKMESLQVKEEVGWSREAVAHVALLQQAASSTPFRSVKEPGLAFEVASIRPSGAAAAAAPGARGAGGSNSGPIRGCVPSTSGYSQQLDPRRLAINKATLFQLIGYAYPVPGVPDTIWKQYPGPDSCLLLSRLGLLPGGPEWVRTDLWDIEAGIPEGSFGSRPMLTDPKLQQMLQKLLEERFKVVIRRETREVPVYLLKVGRNGAKFNGPREVSAPVPLQPEQKPRVIVSRSADGTTTRTVQSQDGTFAGGPPNSVMPGMQVASASRAQEGTIAGGPPSRDGISKLDASKISIANWVNYLFENLGRPVIDRTGLTGRYDFHFDFRGPSIAEVAANPSQFDDLGQSVSREAVKAMGFELEESRAPVEVWVIDRAEKP